MSAAYGNREPNGCGGVIVLFALLVVFGSLAYGSWSLASFLAGAIWRA